ncbi:hypothetical protein GLAREA_02482 [Glarea lozoyensis ATCC 20868]|uniref:Uncharacterized protein n=1 Tax=Glarea lozoyensis (strain ATCC 20868 / MF5171) TaxID=1116229 RepID=S3CMY0_GLAL2|nr:uncharacterized protein GLAREA_02482 [Glarea lozoyensis ATCC 20868]EPE26569.1 hypothetical protein GLAREA_02482 [Glarea lozoyensis ATCC 20868]
MARQFQFVTVPDPLKPASFGARKSNQSHVMRQAHAKKRRLQIQKYQNEPLVGAVKQGPTIYDAVLWSPLSQGMTNGKDPFSSMARPLMSEEYFLLDHYIKVVVPFSIGHCSLFDYPGDHQAQMLRDWVGLAIADDTLMVVAVLLSSCRYILQDQPDHPVFTRMALQYKQICLRTLLYQIRAESSSINAMTVAKVVALAIDEVQSGELGIARKHLQGAFAMIHFAGGPIPLRLTGLLERMYNRFIALLSIDAL